MTRDVRLAEPLDRGRRLDSDRGQPRTSPTPNPRSRSGSWSSTSRKAARASTSRKVVEAIQAADPDIVALEEAVTNAGRIAAALGWASWSDRSQVISRYPIVEPADGVGVYVLVEVRPGRVVAVASVHPPAEPYGPELAGRGGTEAEVIELERRIRLPKLDAHLRVLPALAAAGMPVFLLGDFNAPSHLDWTAETVGAALAHAAAGRLADEPGDRGSRVPRRVARGPPGPGRRTRSDLVGEPATDRRVRTGSRDAERPDRPPVCRRARRDPRLRHRRRGGRADVGIAIEPWPSDHRAVVATFDVVPAPMPDGLEVAPPRSGPTRSRRSPWTAPRTASATRSR